MDTCVVLFVVRAWIHVVCPRVVLFVRTVDVDFPRSFACSSLFGFIHFSLFVCLSALLVHVIVVAWQL
ncbi:hypothetical protein V1520DRAFT_347873 [Lipomyces starkeyi]